jgi:hypothetical protein
MSDDPPPARPRKIGSARNGAAYRDRAMTETVAAWNASNDPARIIDDPEMLLSCPAGLLREPGPFCPSGGLGEALGRIVLIANAALAGPAELGAAVAAMHTLLDDIENQR